MLPTSQITMSHQPPRALSTTHLPPRGLDTGVLHDDHCLNSHVLLHPPQIIVAVPEGADLHLQHGHQKGVTRDPAVAHLQNFRVAS